MQISNVNNDTPVDYKALTCHECRNGVGLGFEISMAFQPIVDTESRSIFAYEALVRGANNQPASWVFQHVNKQNLYRFDQTCRIKAIKLAAELNLDKFLCINFMPNAVYQPSLCIKATLSAAQTYNFPTDKLIFEFTEQEQLLDQKHILNIVEHYQQLGFSIAIDDFGAGYSGLALLADVECDLVKLDMALIRNIDTDPRRQAIVESAVSLCKQLNTKLMAEGIETQAELQTLQKLGIKLFQGFYLAKPEFECLPKVVRFS
ncbi:hypothetical protein DS2_06356 [Catenovulum agarivorans DS-2]|uniref:EAL domain-containing protein n=1 Tax=Catenovulum agarivorans DS-2 TaxID=1328313 RepID=W7QG53_9ALTE|nr:EAL domain-containing protein [Catenovulum agarivorans]EWH10891.1 hypothetical protein DS2_06356 [Catenovulum agarivorans DS-2]